MIIKKVVEKVGRLKPHGYTPADLVDWLTELDRKVQMEALLSNAEQVVNYVWESEHKGVIRFVDFETVMIPTGFQFHRIGKVSIRDLENLPNNGDYIVRNVYAEDKMLRLAPAAFAVGEDIGTMVFDGKDAELLLPDGWDHLYELWLYAKISTANCEFDRADNEWAIFKKEWIRFMKWYTTFYPLKGE